MEYILDETALGQHSAVQIAAAFMQMKLGEEIEDIREEKFFFEKKERRRGPAGRGDSGRRSGRTGRGDSGRRSGRDGGRLDQGSRDSARGGSGRQGGRGSERDGRNNSRYAALRIKTKKQGTL